MCSGQQAPFRKLDIRSASLPHFPYPNWHAESPSRPSVGGLGSGCYFLGSEFGFLRRCDGGGGVVFAFATFRPKLV
ncbi:hypothetical protein C1H46_029453 [Malus baccata]|uniref:Uncharacterized protein n=1 Tax=Malus baccata TaxID=106549 RepID=A0A540LFF5_MALBA|nr:hypothetical protein C1H46_029453 [Malus baccata]